MRQDLQASRSKLALKPRPAVLAAGVTMSRQRNALLTRESSQTEAEESQLDIG